MPEVTTSIAKVLGLLVVAVGLFALERIPVDVVTIVLVLSLVLTGTISAQDAFSGFGNDIVITIAGLFVITGGLNRTGVIDLLGRKLLRVGGRSEFRLMAMVMIVAAASAAFLKNTTATAMLVPVVVGLAARTSISPSRLLMPLAFGAILGGTCTLIGTSTNLAVSSSLSRYGMPPYTMFELTPVGVAIVGVGLLYMLAAGRKLLPRRAEPDSLADVYDMRKFVSEVLVRPSSRLVGKTLAAANLSAELDLTVLGVLRGKNERIAPSPDETIEANDLLLVQGKAEDILRVKGEAGLEIKADFKLRDLETHGVELSEVMVLRGSELIGRTLKRLDFRQRYRLTVLAINRQGVVLLSKISDVPLRFGDMLLVQGKREHLRRLASDGNLLVLGAHADAGKRVGKKRYALLAFAVFIGLALPHPWQLPLPVAVLLGVLVLLASRTVRPQEAYAMIEWRLVVLIAGMISFGTAMERTGADRYLAGWVVRLGQGHGAIAVLAGFFLLTVALTQPMSNQAAALVVLPIALRTATALGLNPRTFAVAVTLAASCSFLTPLEPACVLVYAPGRYRFLDFVKVGSVLTVVVFALVLWLVPRFWPL